MTTSRILTAALLLPFLVVLLVYGPVWLLALIVSLVAAVSVFEMGMMIIPPLQSLGQPLDTIKTARRGAPVGLPLTLAIITFIFFLFFTNQPSVHLVVVAVMIFLLIGAGLRGSIDHKMGSLVGLTVSFSYAALPWLCVWQLLLIPNSPLEVVLLLSLVWLCDTGAYFGGRALGKRPLAKMISPGKTIEGTLCSILVGAIVVSGFAPFLQWEVSFFVYPLVGIGGALLTTAGDLLESVCKRFAKVEDSGSILPGHGGLLDCTDGVLTTAPALLLWLNWLG